MIGVADNVSASVEVVGLPVIVAGVSDNTAVLSR